MTALRTTAFALVGAALALPATAQWPAAVQRALSAEYRTCLNSGDARRAVEAAVLACSRNETDRQEAQRKRAYQLALRRLSPVRQAVLSADERTWIPRRDRTCRANSDTYGARAIPALQIAGCTLRETIARRLWLEAFR